MSVIRLSQSHHLLPDSFGNIEQCVFPILGKVESLWTVFKFNWRFLQLMMMMGVIAVSDDQLEDQQIQVSDWFGVRSSVNVV